MPLVRPGDLNLLSMYRFHDHMPIRFDKELTWSINWKFEFKGKGNAETDEKMIQRKKDGGCWVDYATVFYWFQDSPAGFKHEPLAPVADRTRDLMKSSRGEPQEQ